MTKALSIILLICVLWGGIYFSKNYMKKGVSEGTPIALSVGTGIKKPLVITSPTTGLTVGAKYTLKWTGSAPNVEKYYIYLTNASSTKRIFLGGVSASENSLDFTVSAATVGGIIPGWKISIYSTNLDKVSKLDTILLTETPEFIISTGYQNTTYFSGGVGGPATIPVHYGISISRDNPRPTKAPKIKINCPPGVAAMPLDNMWSGNQCGKEFTTTAAPVKDNGFVYVYQLDLVFTNSNSSSQTVSAEATIDGKVMTGEQLVIPSTNSEPWIAKG